MSSRSAGANGISREHELSALRTTPGEGRCSRKCGAPPRDSQAGKTSAGPTTKSASDRLLQSSSTTSLEEQGDSVGLNP